MSTFSGIATKGEKGKSRYQSVDINNLFRASRGESLDTHQHKNTANRRHGMQQLGKVPTARRPPANLPSLKSEYSGNDPAVSLVPSGGTGWGSKPGETGPPPTSTAVATSTTPTPPSTTTTPTTAPPATATVTPPTPAPPAVATPTTVSHGDKSWSSITSSGTENNPIFLAHHGSSYFQQEFPSLSGDASATGTGPKDTSHLPGLSLRPQTEGSWIQGGSRPQGQMGAGAGSQTGTAPAPGPLSLPLGIDVGGGRSNLAPTGGGVGPAGPIPPPPHHYRLMPPFMMRHNMPPGGFPPNYQHGPPRPRIPYSHDARFMPPNRGPSNIDQDELATRPIIKEEDLKTMDEIGRDSGWAVHDEIDYNQTLSFSDEEGAQDDESKSRNYRQSSQNVEKRDVDSKTSEFETESSENEKLNRENSRESENREGHRGWQVPPRPQDMRPAVPRPMVNMQQPRHPPAARQGEEDEVWREKRRIQNEEVANAVERAKQRKEEEEKRYAETRQAAARKLQMLEEKMRSKNGTDKEETTVTPSVNVPHGANTLLPEWEKEKDKSRSRTNSEDKDDKPLKEHYDGFKNAQEGNRGNFGRDRERERDREQRPERESSGFSRQFQNNLPPRFQKQAAERPPPYYRQGSGGSPQPPSGGHPPYEGRWPGGQPNTHYPGSVSNTKSHRNRNDSDREREENNRDRDRINHDGGFDNRDKERYNRPPSRDSQSSESNRKGGNYPEDNKESDHHQDYDNRQCEKGQDSEVSVKKMRDKKPFDQVKFAEHMNALSVPRPEKLHPNFDWDEHDARIRASIEGEPYYGPPEVLDGEELHQRPQRPDSRDSRASRDSRNSRDSIKEDKLIEEISLRETMLSSWADATYKEDKRRKDESNVRRDSHVMSYHQRHVPVPITKEKLEASELNSRSSNLVPLVRGDKKPEVKKTENQWDMGANSGDAWQRITPSPAVKDTDSWADLSGNTASQPSPGLVQEDTTESQVKRDTEENSVTKSNQDREHVESHRQEREKMSRGGHRGMRHDSRPKSSYSGGSYYHRGGPGGGAPWQGAGGRRPQRRPQGGRGGRMHSESDASADEISASTESGKEDKRQEERKHFPRSPNQGSKKSDKDDRPRDGNRKQESDKDSYPGGGRYDKRSYDNNRMGSFEPRGEPSRRGRGGAPFRSKGSAPNVGRRMVDGYGPPTLKKPFSDSLTNNFHDKKMDGASQIKEDGETSHVDKAKLSQQQFQIGFVGHAARFGVKNQGLPSRTRRKSEGEWRDRKPRDGSGRGPRGSIKSGSGSGGEQGEDIWETTSENSEHEAKIREEDSTRRSEEERQNDSSRRNYGSSKGHPRRRDQNNQSVGREKRGGGSYDDSKRSAMLNGTARSQGSKGAKEHLSDSDKKLPRDKDKRNNLDRLDLANTASVVVIDERPEGTAEGDQTVFAADNNGFQEVRSKKNVKEANRQQKEEPHRDNRSKDSRSKLSKPQGSQSPGPPGAASGKSSFGTRNMKIPPRFQKQRDKMQQQQSHDVNEMNKINQGNVPVYSVKDLTSPAPPPSVNAWDKPITATLRSATPPRAPAALPDSCTAEANEHIHSSTSSQRSSPSGEKAVGKLPRESSEKAVLDGTSPPVQTIIFENTNYKSAPMDAMKSKYNNQMNKNNQRPDKPRERKPEDDGMALGFKSPGPEAKTEPIQMPMSFNKNEDNADMKLDFQFDSDLSQLTDDKTSKSITTIQMTRTVQMMAQSSAADLQFKLASVKKVWDTSHGGEDTAAGQTASYTPTFGEEAGSYGKPGDPSVGDDGSNPEGVFSSGQQLQNNANAYNGSTVQNMIKPDPSSNVCKVKPQPQAMHPHSPLSPPSAFISSQAQSSQHISYQIQDTKLEPKPWIPNRESDSQKAALNQSVIYTYLSDEPWRKVQPTDPHLCRPNITPPAQYGGMSAIPSPPAVFTPQPELYPPTFQINNPPQVIGSQGRSHMSQYGYQLSQGLGQTSAFGTQSMYLHQTGPPPTAPAAPPHPDMFQPPQYRLQPPGYANSQQIGNNPNTMLISSGTTSLVSASVKPSQPIGAIGSKAPSYQTTSQPPNPQLYIYQPADPQLLNQSQFSQLVQRPGNSVVPTIPPSSASYYSASTGGGAAGYYPTGNSSLQFNLQAAFNTQSPAATPAGMGSFGNFLSNGLQMAQQYRSNAPSYLKSADHQPDVLSVFSSPATQIISPKSRPANGGKQNPTGGPPQQQPSPPQGHHKLSAYQQNVSPTAQLMIQQQQQHQQQRGSMRYPAPIQRPVTFQPRHRPPARYNRPPAQPPATVAASAASHYYVSQNNSSKLDNTNMEAKVEVASNECEISSSATTNTSSEATENSTLANN